MPLVLPLLVKGVSVDPMQAAPGEPPQMSFGRGVIIVQLQPVGPTGNRNALVVGSLDKTGLEGTHDFSLHWTPDERRGVEEEEGPSIFAAIQEQLGLKLLQSNEETAPVKMLVADHAEQAKGS